MDICTKLTEDDKRHINEINRLLRRADLLGRFILTALIFIIFVGGAVILTYGDDEVSEPAAPPETREIKGMVLSAEDRSTSNGWFVLGVAGYGSKNIEDMKYYVYVKNVEGFRLQEIEAENVEIVETDKVSPSIKGLFGEGSRIVNYQSYVMYVPEGTIYEKYSADTTKPK